MALRAGRLCLSVLARHEKPTLSCARPVIGHEEIALATAKISSHVGRDIRTRKLNPLLRPLTLTHNRFFSSLFSSSGKTMTLAPPQAPLKWNHSAGDITRLTKVALEKYRQVLDRVGSLDPKDCTFESVGFYTVYYPHYALTS